MNFQISIPWVQYQKFQGWEMASSDWSSLMGVDWKRSQVRAGDIRAFGHLLRVNQSPKGIMRAEVPIPCFFDVVKSDGSRAAAPMEDKVL